jgi:hypothetical protein
MTAADVIETARAHLDGELVAVHMEAINHCLVTRADLRRALDEAGVEAWLPDDGETILCERGPP